MESVKYRTDNDIYLKKPKLYAVTMHNDDYTTMDFVVDILIKIFHKTHEQAANIMLSVHNNGKGIAGVYTLDIAMTKKLQTEQSAKEKNFPLKITLEEAME